MFRSRKGWIAYKKSNQKGCPFCNLKAAHVVHDGTYIQVIENIYPYSWWDATKVHEHLMVIPKKHTDTISSLSKSARMEYIDTLAKYEKKGYSIYARTAVSVRKTVVHQHTHLIKTDNRVRKFALYIRKPYITIYK